MIPAPFARGAPVARLRLPPFHLPSLSRMYMSAAPARRLLVSGSSSASTKARRDAES